MKIHMFLILFLFLYTVAGCAQNVPSGTVYLLFDDSSQEKCQNNKNELKKFRKEDNSKTLTFFMYVLNSLYLTKNMQSRIQHPLKISLRIK